MNKKKNYIVPTTTVISMDTAVAFLEGSGTTTSTIDSPKNDEQIQSATWDW